MGDIRGRCDKIGKNLLVYFTMEKMPLITYVIFYIKTTLEGCV